MSDPRYPSKNITSAVLTLLFVALCARVAWELLAPVVPLLVVALCLVFILGRLLGFRRW